MSCLLTPYDYNDSRNSRKSPLWRWQRSKWHFGLFFLFARNPYRNFKQGQSTYVMARSSKLTKEISSSRRQGPNKSEQQGWPEKVLIWLDSEQVFNQQANTNSKGASMKRLRWKKQLAPCVTTLLLQLGLFFSASKMRESVISLNLRCPYDLTFCHGMAKTGTFQRCFLFVVKHNEGEALHFVCGTFQKPFVCRL